MSGNGEDKDYERMAELFGADALACVRRLPEHMHHAAMGYLLRGWPVGDFLEEVFKNSLTGAFSRADFTNEANMKRWAEFLYQVMPTSPVRSYGSKEAFEGWQKLGGMEGLLKQRVKS